MYSGLSVLLRHLICCIAGIIPTNWGPPADSIVDRRQDWGGGESNWPSADTGSVVLCQLSSMSFSANGKSLLALHYFGRIVLWDVQTGKRLSTLIDLDPVSYVGPTSICLSPNGKLVASGRRERGKRRRFITIWDLKSGKPLRRLSGHVGTITSLEFSPDGKILASAGFDETVRLWNVTTGKELHTLKTHSHSVWSVAFHPAGALLASASSDKTVKLWDVKSGKEVMTFTGHRDKIYSVCFSPDGAQLISGGFDKSVKLWNVKTGKSVKTFVGHQKTVLSVSFSPSGKIIASGSSNGVIKLWDVKTGKVMRTLVGQKDKDSAVVDLRFSPDGKTLASYGKDVTLWNVETGVSIRTFVRPGER